ncbi:MAG: major facilitator superfamily 1 [Gammaproteobacteria bacterium]|nr:major facilitator superfamily 1 [Gammaproteobacteria bacterium]
MPDPRPKSWTNSAGWGLAILSFVNLFNYLDRYLVPALFESLKRSELKLSDAQLGLLMSCFLAVYTLTAPLFGALGDRKARPRLIAFGVGCWSLATTLSGFAGSFVVLLAARASVGIGEAAYGTIAPSLLSDYFPPDKRGRTMAIFFCAIPVGSALGYVVGGLMDVHFGWRAAFFVAGVPGLLLAILCLWMKDPPRGSQDTGLSPADKAQIATDSSSARGTLGSATKATYGLLLRNRPYVFTVLGYAAYTFAMGGLASWMPAFLERVRGMPHGQATISFGYIVVITGFVGTFVGGWLGDYCLKYSKQAYLLVSAIATLVAAPFVWFALTAASSTAYLACMVTAQLLMFLSTGPINATIVNLVLPTQRASAVALEVFAIHLLGDAISPYLIGAVSDASSLAQAVKIVPAAVIVSGGLWAWAAREQRARCPAGRRKAP